MNLRITYVAVETSRVSCKRRKSCQNTLARFSDRIAEGLWNETKHAFPLLVRCTIRFSRLENETHGGRSVGRTSPRVSHMRTLLATMVDQLNHRRICVRRNSKNQTVPT